MDTVKKILDSPNSHPNMFLIGFILFIVLLSLFLILFLKKNKKVIRLNDSESDEVGRHFDPSSRLAHSERDFYRSISGINVDDNDPERKPRRG
jgi:hypothetical protein